MKLRSYLAVLVLAGVVPLMALTVVLTITLARHQRIAVDRGLSDTVAAFALALENDLRTSIRSLETLATSTTLDNDSFAAFYEEASRLRGLHRWTTIGLIDREGTHRLNIARPLGAELPDLRDRTYFKEVVASSRPYVSDLITGRATATRDIAVAVPVLREGRVKHVIFAGLEPVSFNTVVDSQKIPEQAITWVVSRDGLFLARSPSHDRWVGRPPPEYYLAQFRTSPDGIFRGIDAEGIARDTAYRRMALTGWSVGFGLPSELVNAPVRRVIVAGAIVGAVIVVAALGLAVMLARRMASSIATLGASASALGRGEPVTTPTRLPIAELDEMGRFLGDADVLLRERARERDELLRAERAARADAEAASTAKDQFLAMLGHELRNPLGAIAGAVSVLNLPGAPAESAERARGVIGRQVQHLSRLVDDLLDVSRVTTGKIVLDRRPIDLGDLVTNVVATYRASGRLARHEIVVEATPVWIEADETRIEQVVSNLLSNALKYTPAGGRVAVRVSAEGATAQLAVADTGIGLPPELVHRVFDVFVQGDRPLDRSQGGLGLGLTLVRALVTAHGGTVSASSDGVARGAVFTVKLPRLLAPATGPPPAITPPTIGRRRVLVVEDNDDARDMLRTLLALEGHEVHETASGQAGVDLARTLAPDVALIDIGLPGLDGYEVARRIRAHLGRSVLLIAITGYGQPEDRQRAFDAGFDAHLTKPLVPERLMQYMGGRGGEGYS